MSKRTTNGNNPPFRTIGAREAGADLYSAHDNIIAGAGSIYSSYAMFAAASASGEVHREPLEIGERAVGEGGFVCSPKDHAGRRARLERVLPAR